jgi:hypothetical protein
MNKNPYVLFISAFNYYEIRIQHLVKSLIELGGDYKYVTSDWDHIKKSKYKNNYDNSHQIKVPKYNKNLSLQRIFSHAVFAIKLVKYAKRYNFTHIYAMIPPNYITKVLSKYAIRNGINLTFDVYDLWPESLPINTKLKQSFLFNVWKGFRERHLLKANNLVFECEGFKNYCLGNSDSYNAHVVYPHNGEYIDTNLKLPSESVNICYLGSINNIIDIDLIADIIQKINRIKKVSFHIIGDGEKKDELLSVCETLNINYIYYGKVFDKEEKSTILKNCHFGLNIMKNSVFVGMTMKSIDYFKHGLPIINNIKMDTLKFVNDYSIGFNIDDSNIDATTFEIANLKNTDVLIMSENVRKMYEKHFSLNKYQELAISVFRF